MLSGLFTGARAPSTTAIPLFPLRTVLFPGGRLPLKVFEQRYIDMTKACLRQEQPFGVVMITAGDEVATRGGTPSFANFGTLAQSAFARRHQIRLAHDCLSRFDLTGHCKTRIHIAAQQQVQLFFLFSQLVRNRHQLILRFRQTRLNIHLVGFERDLLHHVLAGHAIEFLVKRH